MGAILSISSPNNIFEWMAFLAEKYSSMFLQGTWITLYVSVIGTIVGFILGYIVGIVGDIKIHKEDNPIKKGIIKFFKFICFLYVELFRGTPMIVQAMIVYFGLRQGGVNINPIIAGILVTVLNTGAYMSETVRAGIKSIDAGQREGALAMGMSPMQVLCNPSTGIQEHYPRDGEHIPDEPEDDICVECNRYSGVVHAGKNGRWYILQVF